MPVQGPRQGKSIGICEIQLQERNVFFPFIEVVRCVILGQAIRSGPFACAGTRVGERVPDRRRAEAVDKPLICAQRR